MFGLRHHRGWSSLALCGFVIGSAGPRLAADPPTLRNPQINESSGLAVSRRDPELLWTHNDSGDRPRIFAVDRQGNDRGSVEVFGAAAVDWEDIAAFRRDGEPRLIVADSGDNDHRREEIRLYEFAEPILPQHRGVHVERVYVIRWPGGPIDCESVAVDEPCGQILLLSKARGFKAILCAVPWTSGTAPDQPTEPVTAKLLAEPMLPLATSMDLSEDGRQLAVLTPFSALLFRRDGEPVTESQWPGAMQQVAAIFPINQLRQAEALAIEPDARRVWVCSEGVGSPLVQIDLPSSGDPPSSGDVDR